MVGDGWNPACFQTVEHAGVFDANRHWVSGESFRVCNNQLIGRISEGVSKRLDFGLGRTSTGGRVGFMGKEDRIGSHSVAIKTPSSLHIRHETIDHLSHVFNVQSSSMISRISRRGTQEFCNGLNTTLLSFGISLYHESGGPHSKNQTVSTSVKRKGGFLDHVVGGRSARGRETTSNPFPHVIAGNIVAADDDHSVNPAGIQPVFGDAKGCRSGGAGKIDGRVGAPNTGVLSKL